jgi:hypothetical protein
MLCTAYPSVMVLLCQECIGGTLVLVCPFTRAACAHSKLDRVFFPASPCLCVLAAILPPPTRQSVQGRLLRPWLGFLIPAEPTVVGVLAGRGRLHAVLSLDAVWVERCRHIVHDSCMVGCCSLTVLVDLVNACQS